MTIFGCCPSDTESEPDNLGVNDVPSIHPTTRRAAVSGDTSVVHDAGRNARTNDPEPVDSAGATHPSGVEIIGNEHGGSQIRGNFGEAEHITWHNGKLHVTRDDGSSYVLGGDGRQTQTAPGQPDRSQHDEQRSTTRNRRPVDRSRRDNGGTRKAEPSSLQGSFTGLDGSTGSDQHAKPEQGDVRSDWGSEARTLTGGVGGANSDSFSSFNGHSEHTYYGNSSFSQSEIVSSERSSHQIIGPNQNNNDGPRFQFNGNVTNFFGNPNDRQFEFNGRVKYVNGRRNI